MKYILQFYAIHCFVFPNVLGKHFNPENVTVTIEQGTLFGKQSTDFENETYYSFEGIPYAKPPIGVLRFKAPEPPEPWTGIYNATGTKIVCPQPFFEDYYNESCLLLNVYSQMKDQLQPVMVYIHGGGFESGGTNYIFKLYMGPQFFIQEGVVVVEIQYRLNIFGFINFNDSKYDIPGNAGLKDQVMALKWIQKNIAEFGGDPNNVTIFGESAGGASVHLLYLSPLTKGLFHRAISQSGAATNPWITGRNKAFELAEVMECPTNTMDEIFQCINSTSTYHLIQRGIYYLKAIMAISPPKNGEMFAFNSLTIESDNQNSFISQNPEQIAESGSFNKVPILMGFNSDEGVTFIDTNPVKPVFTDNRTLIPKDINIDLTSDEAYYLGNRIKEFYYGSQTPSYGAINPYIDFVTDTLFLQQIYKFAKLQSNYYNATYFYHFDYFTSLNTPHVLNTERKLISHADELPYLFYYSLKNYSQPDPNIKEGIYRMVKLWTTFAKTGDPNLKDDPSLNVTWLPVQPEKFNYLHINPKLDLKQDPCKDRMKFWEDIYAEYN